MRSLIRTAWISWVSIGLLSCASPPEASQSFDAIWLPAGQSEPVGVSFHWRPYGHEAARIAAQLGGRRFVGWVGRIREEGSPVITSIYQAWDSPAYAPHRWPPDFEGFEPVDYATFVRAYSGRVLATLEAPDASQLRCNLVAHDAKDLLARPAGHCQISDGGMIRVD